jgi:hypothetical protein
MKYFRVINLIVIFFIIIPSIDAANITQNSQNRGSLYSSQENTFTHEDRERLIRLEVTMKEFKESVDKRFEQVDKRFAELRDDMNKHFDQMMNFLWILVTIFVAITAANIGFAYWDRRTIIKKSTDEAVARIEKEGRVSDVISALRELSKDDQKVANLLRKFNLL